ncbi:endolytic transglycosylase MltG [Candidatus Saccharibacteria bacterium]|nr:endolytic transglycosylase MltG [Candidatus Saccharibacteria bacterium]
MTPKYNFLNKAPTGLTTPKRKKSGAKVFLQTILILGIVLAVAAAAAGIWFWNMTKPADRGAEEERVFLVEPNESVKTIGERLESDGMIRSAAAFWFYARVVQRGVVIETGRYRLSPSMPMLDVIRTLTAGGEKAPTAMITFLPGGNKFDAFAAMRSVGFDDTQINRLDGEDYLLEIQAKFPRLFEGWTTDKGLEGFFWGDTYEIFLDNGSRGALNRALQQMDSVIDNELIAKLAESGRTFYESLILASIITLEEPRYEEQKIVAQIFINRLEIGMELGSDPTYKYGARLLGVESHRDLDTPFNTRLHAGLTPTPIATPSLSALQALASPTPTDALFFLSGDDDALRTARTYAEHEANILNYCRVKCFSYH